MATKPRFYMVGLLTGDMERSQDFYSRLGIAFEDTEGSHREAQVPGFTFFLDERPSAWHPGIEQRPYPWLLEFYFESLADLRAKLGELRQAGAALIDEPYDTGFGMWFAFVADPDGNTVLLSAEKSAADE